MDDLTTQIVDAISEAVVAIGADGRMLFANRQAEAMFDYRREELVGQPVTMLMADAPRYLPADGKKLECPGRRRDGVEFPMSVTITAMGTPDGPMAVGTMRDMSEHEEAQAGEKEFFKSMINSLPGVFYLFDATGKFIQWNENLEKVTGRAAAEVAGINPLEFFDDVERPLVAEKIEEVFTLGHSTVEARLVNKGGKKTPFLFTGQLIEIDKRPCLVGMGIDVSERKRAEDEVKAKEMQIRQAYVDVFSAVTGEKLIIMTPAEVEAALGEPLTAAYEVREYEEMAGARAALRAAMAEDFPALRTPADLVVAACEALTNAVKHAGSGTLRVFKAGRTMQILVADRSPGIDFSLLPKAALTSGFSTRQTLGMGFTIMLEYADKVLLATEAGSTAVVLEAA